MNNPQQQSLFPARESVEEVMQEGLAKLPIENPNELIALLQLQQNTILSISTDSGGTSNG